MKVIQVTNVHQALLTTIIDMLSCVLTDQLNVEALIFI